MTNQDFHIGKEKDTKSINKIIQTVKGADFHEETKNIFIKEGSNVIKCLIAQRGHIYKELENFEFEDKYTHNDPQFEAVDIFAVKETQTARTIHGQILQVISEVIGRAEKNKAENSIVDQSNNNKVILDENYKHSEDYIIKHLEMLVDAIEGEEELDQIEEAARLKAENEANPTVDPSATLDPNEMIKYKLVEEDFDNNPDLAKAGFNIGDEIEINPKDFIIATENDPNLDNIELLKKDQKEEEKVPEIPNGSAVLSQEEIIKGNATEKATPRKRSSKK